MNQPDLLALYQVLIERSPLALAVTVGGVHRHRCVNAAFARLTGVPATALLERTFEATFPDSATDGSLALLDRVWQTGEAERVLEIERRCADGGTAFWDYAVWPVPDGERHPAGLIIEISDATARVRARQSAAATAEEMREINQRLLLAGVHEQELAEQAELHSAEMDALLESANDGVAIVDAEGRVTLLNPAGRTIIGVQPDADARLPTAYRGVDFRRLDGTPLPAGEWPIPRALRGERFSHDEALVVRADGSRRRVTFSGSAIRDNAGRVTLAIIVFRDVTALRELEELKDQFIGLVSHDLRSPLSAILGFAELLRGRLSAARRAAEVRQASAIMRAAKQMSAMIQDLLESTRLESAKLELHPRPCELRHLVAAAVRRLSGDARPRIRIDAPPDLPRVVVDPQRLDRAITNLLTNALKFSWPETPVMPRIERRGDEIVVSVTDRGEGIPPEHLPYLFERFYRAKAGAKTEGLGLGLYITRLIIEAHGGRVWAASEPGKGSTFSFALPIERADG